MKCGFCKNEVDKDVAVKDGKTYFHKECHKKKLGKREIEEYWLNEINKGTVLQILRKFIKEAVEIYDVDYILWTMKKCKEKKINLQYPMGLKKILDQREFKDEWEKGRLLEATREMKDKFENHINTEQSEINYINRSRNFIKLL